MEREKPGLQRVNKGKMESCGKRKFREKYQGGEGLGGATTINCEGSIEIVFKGEKKRNTPGKEHRLYKLGLVRNYTNEGIEGVES